MKVVFCSSEMVPFAKTGGLADVAGALPLVLEELGEEVIVTLPLYRSVLKGKWKLDKVKEDIYSTTVGKNIKVYFIRKDEYFDRDQLYMDKKADYPDNLDRFSFYCKRTLTLLKEINFSPDIIHVHDWQACLIPVYLKAIYGKDPLFAQTKSVLTIHNIGYQGLFAKEEFAKLGLDESYFHMDKLEYFGKISLLKGGIVFSDSITTVSPTYSKEIQTKAFGLGFEGLLAKRAKDLHGILNGLDYSIWNPETDPHIAQNFSVSCIEKKLNNKTDLQKICSLPQKKELPLLGIVSRLTVQKGFDILAADIEKICTMKLQLVILGTGEEKYHVLLDAIAKKYPSTISLHLKFDDSLAHKIYAGSDIFLMPSQYEPCGLGQMISLRYGTIPLVFKTGGLADTVNKENGYVFDTYTAAALIKTVKESVSDFHKREKWDKKVRAAMEYNFSWRESAKHYIALYAKAKKQ